ncbi:MAG: hypothetical protein KDJ28_01605 [Candidatus Competibacteraceae bacterium]|nr:hypothetical protein [Candidatus Competibacteraceae bacterium]
MKNSKLKPCRLSASVANLLGLPAAALTPGAQLLISDTEHLWFDSVAGVAIWQREGLQQGFPADSLEEALARVRCDNVG